MREKEEYDKDHDKQKHINNIWRNDDIFIDKAKNSRDDPIVGNLASKLISAKEQLEQRGLMDTKRFSGFGADPVARLRDIVQQSHTKHKNKQTGGAIPPILIPIIASVVGSLAGKIYDTIKEKIQGKGIEFPVYRKHKDKHNYVIKMLKSI